MIGIVPSSNRTFEVDGLFDTRTKIEGHVYADPSDRRLYIFSDSLTRSGPETGYFPIWNGEDKYTSMFSNTKYLDTDVIMTGTSEMVSKLDSHLADKIRYRQRRSSNNDVLVPVINGSDNMFTQVIKGILLEKKLTLIDLIDLSGLPEKIILNYYTALTKIAFMRIERWEIWVNQIFRVKYSISVYRESQKLLTYSYPESKFDCGMICYNDIIDPKDDQFKRIVKVLMIKENISKQDLRSAEVNDYTVNNLLTTLSTNKPLSSQLFSRFMRISSLNYIVEVYDDGQKIFEYKE